MKIKECLLFVIVAVVVGCPGVIYIPRDLRVGDDVKIEDDLVVEGDVSVDGSVTAGEVVAETGNLGGVIFDRDGNLIVPGDLDVGGDANVIGDVGVGGEIVELPVPEVPEPDDNENTNINANDNEGDNDNDNVANDDDGNQNANDSGNINDNTDSGNENNNENDNVDDNTNGNNNENENVNDNGTDDEEPLPLFANLLEPINGAHFGINEEFAVVIDVSGGVMPYTVVCLVPGGARFEEEFAGNLVCLVISIADPTNEAMYCQVSDAEDRKTAMLSAWLIVP